MRRYRNTREGAEVDMPREVRMRAGSILRLTARVAVLTLAVGCHGGAQKAGDALTRADTAATQFSGALRARLVDAMAHGGPPNAVAACSTDAQGIRSAVEGDAGVKLGRASLRLRNPADAAPDWVAEWLVAQGERDALGVAGVRAVVDTPAGKVARVLRPIAIEASCLACHGAEGQMDPVARTAIRARYPTDSATGYRVGDLRGALWVEAPLE